MPTILPSPFLRHEKPARLLSVLLPVINSEPLFYIAEVVTTEDYPFVAVYGGPGAPGRQLARRR